jgi:type VI protein secretion system component VasK
MNRVNIFGVSVPIIFLIYLAIRIFQRAKDSKIEKEVEEKIRKMTPEERDLYAKDLKGKMKELLNRPKTTFEKIANAVFIGIFSILGVGAIVGIIYFKFFEN